MKVFLIGSILIASAVSTSAYVLINEIDKRRDWSKPVQPAECISRVVRLNWDYFTKQSQRNLNADCKK